MWVKITFLLVINLLHLSFKTNAQQKEITGRVTDASTGLPLPGAIILKLPSRIGAVANNAGEFKISTETGQKLLITENGYRIKEIEVKNRKRYHIRLIPVIDPVSESIETGYRIASLKSTTGSVQSIQSNHFNRGLISDVQQLIIGKVAGLQITRNGGAPAENSSFALRGTSLLGGESNPLFVIDGMPLHNHGVSGIRNPFTILNPSDIELVTVMKDAAATSIYGSRGANGVVWMTSKMAKSGQPLRIRYQALVSVGKITDKYNVFNADEFRNMVISRYSTYQYAIRLLGDSDTKWQDKIYQTSLSTDHMLSVAGNQGGVPYRASYGFTDEKGILATDKFSRVTMSLGVNPNFLNDQLKIKLNLKLMLNNNRFAPRNTIATSARFDPTQPVSNNSPFKGFFTWTDPNGSPLPTAPLNPVANIEMTGDYSRIVGSIGNLHLDYRLNKMPDFRINLNMGYDVSRGSGLILLPENFPSVYDPVNGGGSIREYDQNRNGSLIDLYLNYTKDFDWSNFEAVAGVSRHTFHTLGKDHDFNTVETILKDQAFLDSSNTIASFFGKFQYTLWSKFIFSAVVRQDRNSYYSVDNQWNTSPAVSFGWILSEGKLFKKLKAINLLKLRYSYGISGYSATNSHFMPQLINWQLSRYNYQMLSGDRWHWRSLTFRADPDLKMENTTSQNIGLDFSFADFRLSGSIDAYHRITRDFVTYAPTEVSVIPHSMMLINAGSLQNMGVELVLNMVPVKTSSVTWDIAFNAAYNENKVRSLMYSNANLTSPLQGSPGYYNQILTPGYPTSSFFLHKQYYSLDNKPLEGIYVERADGHIISGDNRFVNKKSAPDYIIGLNSQIKWNNLDLFISGRSNVGNYVYNLIWSHAGNYRNLFNQDGFLSSPDKNIVKTNFQNPNYTSDYYLSDGSFIKIDNVSLGYNIYRIFGRKTKTRFYAVMQNVATFTRYKGIDPEVIQGIDYYNYPRPMNMIYGLTIDF